MSKRTRPSLLAIVLILLGFTALLLERCTEFTASETAQTARATP